MGQKQSCGIGILNLSNWEEINVGLSMGRTHYFENGVKKGTIFYRWPGAVYYTVNIYPREQHGSNDITYIRGCSSAERIFKLRNCYAGGRGTWIIVKGGAFTDENGKLWPSDLEFTWSTQEEVFRNGTFTWYSHRQFHTYEGLRCTENCHYCGIELETDT